MTNVKVVRHVPEPVPQPPATYDILGLTEDEIKILLYALGRTNWDDAAAAGCTDNNVGYDLYSRLYHGLPHEYQPK
jgi:hypothetical protein